MMREAGGGGALINHCIDYKLLGIKLAKCRKEVRRREIGVVVHLPYKSLP
jgi:hypothetical protein